MANTISTVSGIMMHGLSGGRTPQGIRYTLRSIMEKKIFTGTLIVEELQYGNPFGNAHYCQEKTWDIHMCNAYSVVRHLLIQVELEQLP
jgi:hypothetical protein